MAETIATREHSARPSARPAPSRKVLAAAGWMMTAVVSFTLVAIAAREATKGVAVIQMVFWRSLMAFAFVVLAMLVTRQSFRQLLTARAGLHWLRNALHFCAQFSWLTALTLIPLAQLFAIEFTAPLWVAVIAPLVLGERLTVMRVLAAILGFAGILVIVRPGLADVSTGAIFAFAASLGFATSMICTKKLTRTDSIATVLFYMFGLQTLIAFIPAWPGLQALEPETWGWIAAVALAGLTSHYALTRAFTLADAMVVAPMDFIRLPLIAFLGVWLYGEPLEPWVLIGGGIVVAGNIVNMWGERRKGER